MLLWNLCFCVVFRCQNSAMLKLLRRARNLRPIVWTLTDVYRTLTSCRRWWETSPSHRPSPAWNLGRSEVPPWPQTHVQPIVIHTAGSAAAELHTSPQLKTSATVTTTALRLQHGNSHRCSGVPFRTPRVNQPRSKLHKIFISWWFISSFSHVSFRWPSTKNSFGWFGTLFRIYITIYQFVYHVKDFWLMTAFAKLPGAHSWYPHSGVCWSIVVICT